MVCVLGNRKKVGVIAAGLTRSLCFSLKSVSNNKKSIHRVLMRIKEKCWLRAKPDARLAHCECSGNLGHDFC